MTALAGEKCPCGLEAEGRCDWPVERFAPKKVADLKLNDVCANGSKTRTGWVLNIESTIYIDTVEVTVERMYKAQRTPYGKTGSRVDKYNWPSDGNVLVLTAEPCGQPACYQHIRELGAAQFICREHWRDQLERIGA
jgi:hypothetical protein